MAVPRAGSSETSPAEPFELAEFGSLNTKVPRPAIGEQEFSWNENWMPIGPGELRTMWGEGPTAYTAAGKTIIYAYSYVISGVAYYAIFLSDGTAVQMLQGTPNTVTVISSAVGTFYAGTDLPACSQFQNKYLAIVSTSQTNGYWLWDGTNLYTAGTLAPDFTITNSGKGFISTPTVAITAGSGVSPVAATATAVVKNGVVTGLTITSPGSGYALGDLPVATISGGGTDSSAAAVAVISTTTGGLSSVNVLAGGSGYTTSTVLTISGGGGSGATAVVTGLTNGAITGVAITNEGVGYITPPTISASVGSGAIFICNISSNGILQINVTSPGTNYVGAPTVTITGDGVGATAIVNMAVNTVAFVTVTNGGSGYTSAPTVTFSGTATTQATGSAIINAGGQVVAVIIRSPGVNYTGTASVAFSGGGGTSAAASCNMTVGGSGVQSIIITNPGSGYTHAAVTFSGGNLSASVAISAMPYGVQGTTIETYQNRLWIGNGINALATAPGSTSNFAISAGGVAYQVTDNQLRQKITRFIAANGFLYQFGDSSISVITNVQVSTTGVTTYNNSNVDPQMGTIWPNSVVAFGRALVFANSSGVYALYGGAAEKISDQLDRLVFRANFSSGVTPTSAVATLFGVRVFMINFTTVSPYDGTTRTMMFAWNGQKWFGLSQTKVCSFILTSEINSTLGATGTDGTNFFPMFTTPTNSTTKVFQARLRPAQSGYMTTKQSLRAYYLAQNNSTDLTSNLNVAMDTEAGAGTFTSNAVSTTTPAVYGFGQGVYGNLLGPTVTTTAADVSLISMAYFYEDYAPVG